MTYVLAGLLALIAGELWLLRRCLGSRLDALSRLEDDLEVRMASLTRSLELLTDTTETGFNALAAFLESAPVRPAASRTTRQRRVVGAASDGRTVAEIAAQEELAETEVRLRLHLARQGAAQGKDHHGALRS
jgi:hypothetical protein